MTLLPGFRRRWDSGPPAHSNSNFNLHNKPYKFIVVRIIVQVKGEQDESYQFL